MDLNKFIEQRPFLYHLTSKDNAPNILKQRKLFSANQLITASEVDEIQKVKREKRSEHFSVIVNGTEILLRDQRPISEKALSKCLTGNWGIGDFLYHLNDRVFMWPTEERLFRHFNRYAHEVPIIFRFSTQEIFEVNPHAKFCRLNSGATRANSHLGGKAPERGLGTFLSATEFNLPVRSVAEVTFEDYCILPKNISYSYNPHEQYKEIVKYIL